MIRKTILAMTLAALAGCADSSDRFLIDPPAAATASCTSGSSFHTTLRLRMV